MWWLFDGADSLSLEQGKEHPQFKGWQSCGVALDAMGEGPG